MDKYLTLFSEQLDEAFETEISPAGKEFYVMKWLKQKLIIRKDGKKILKKKLPKIHHSLKQTVTA